MGKMTFIVAFEDGKEPEVSAAMQIAGGRLIAASFFDYRDDFFTCQQRNKIENVLEEADWHGIISESEADAIMEKVELLTQ